MHKGDCEDESLVILRAREEKAVDKPYPTAVIGQFDSDTHAAAPSQNGTTKLTLATWHHDQCIGTRSCGNSSISLERDCRSVNVQQNQASEATDDEHFQPKMVKAMEN